MINRFIHKTLLAAAALMALAGAGAAAEKLVILHTNDTHSLIEPNGKGQGGVLQRKALFDSVRRADKNVIAVDAGDAVQGSLYFKFFGGDVEYPVMNMLGYDIRILGNHEFDNGLEDLARHWKTVKAKSLSANYDFTGTPLQGMFDPWTIRKVDGKKIGFIGLNVDPESLIAASNYEGMKFRDIIRTANETAAFLKRKKGCDLIVAVTHIGYVESNDKTTDVDLARASRDIDIIIGGHSHTLIDPAHPEKYPSLVKNADGRNVLVAQVGKSGLYVGRIEIDLDKVGRKALDGSEFGYSILPVTDHYAPSRLDRGMEDFIGTYKARVDSVNNRVIAVSTSELPYGQRTGAFPNWTGDFGRWYGRLVADSLRRAGNGLGDLDLSLMNVGGIRSSWAKGDITEGEVLSTFPFSNHMVLMKIKGSDLLETLRIAARKGGEAVSGDIMVVTDGGGEVRHALVDGVEIDPDREYLMSTIDYLAWGNDDLTPLARGEWVWRDPVEMSAPMLRYIDHLTSLGLPVMADPNPRFVRAVTIP